MKPCGTNLVKIKGAQLKVNLHNSSALNADEESYKNYDELVGCKVHEKCLCLLMLALFWNFEFQQLCQEALDHHGSLTIFARHLKHYQSV